MGWTSVYGHNSKKEVTDELLSGYRRENGVTVLGSASAAGCFYIAIQSANAPKGIILVYLVEKHGREWDVKGMDEGMGPNAINCPLSLLNITEGDGSKWSLEWRARVEAYHAARRRSFEIGSRVSIYGKFYKVVGMITKKSYDIVSEETGARFRSTAQKMQPV